MKMQKIVKRKLNCGGILCVLEKRWYLEFPIQGVDMRYKKRSFRISENELRNYCKELKENFAEYQKLKEQGTTMQVKGKGGMWIRFGFQEGVCLYEQWHPIRREEDLKRIVKELESVPKLVKEINGHKE